MRRLATDIVVELPSKRLVLKPTLRAAAILAVKYDGSFQNLANALYRGELRAFNDIVRYGTGVDSALTDYIDTHNDVPLNVALNLLVRQAVAFIHALTGADHPEGDSASVNATGKVTFPEFYQRLFYLATGWLQWSPDEALDATPAQIIAAYQALCEKLKAIHGGGSRDEETVVDLTKMDKEARRAALNDLVS